MKPFRINVRERIIVDNKYVPIFIHADLSALRDLGNPCNLMQAAIPNKEFGIKKKHDLY